MNKKEAIDFAKKLYDVKILSKKGKKLLINQIKGEQFQGRRQSSLKDGSIHILRELSKSGILSFVGNAFMTDLNYRSGMLEKNRLYNEYDEQDLEFLGERNEKMDSILAERLKVFEGFKIEAAIEVEDSFPDGSWLVFPPLISIEDDYGLIHDERSVLGKTCTRTANDLLKIGLIDTSLHIDILAKIKSSELFAEGYVVKYAANKVSYFENYEYYKKEEIDFVKGLYDVGVIKKENLDKLLDSYAPLELKKKYDLLTYCENAKKFILENYPLSAVEAYKRIFEDITALIPDFEFTEFELIFEKQERDFITDTLNALDATIKFKSSGDFYKYSFFYTTFNKHELIGEVPMKINIDFHSGINKWLADKESPYRLYYANKNEVYKTGSAYGEKEFWLILLTEEQFKAFGSMNSDYFLFDQNHDNFFNSKSIAEAINLYEDLGLFVHLDGEEKMLARQCVEEKMIEKFQDILICFPKTVAYIYWENNNFENPYEELAKKFSLISKGIFNPININDNYGKDGEQGKDSTVFSFEFKGEKYSKELKMRRDWLVKGLIEFIESVLIKNNIDGRFYYCFENGEASGYIFLTKNQYEILRDKQKSLFNAY